MRRALSRSLAFAGQALECAHEGRRIELAVAGAHQRVHLLCDQRSARQRCRGLLRVVHDNRHVLVVQLDLEAGLVVGVEHALAVDLEDAAAGEAAHQCLAHLHRVDAVAACEKNRLGNALEGEADDDLVAALDDLAGAVAADVDDAAAEDLEQRAHLVEDRYFSADHDRERAFARAGFASGHRRVEHVHAALGERGGDATGGGRGDGAHVDDDVAGFGALDEAAVAENDLLDVGRVGDDGKGDVGFGCDLGGGALAEGPPYQDGLDAVEAAAVDGQLVPRAQQVFRHRAAHDAAADESDFHDASPFNNPSQNGSVTNPARVDQPMIRLAMRVSRPKRSASAMTITMVGIAASSTAASPGSDSPPGHASAMPSASSGIRASLIASAAKITLCGRRSCHGMVRPSTKSISGMVGLPAQRAASISGSMPAPERLAAMPSANPHTGGSVSHIRRNEACSSWRPQ